MGFTNEKDLAGPVALVLIIVADGASWLHGQWLTRLAEQLFACLLKGDRRALGGIRLRRQIHYVFHTGHKLPAHLGQTPRLVPPRLEGVFLSTWRTVSRAIEGL